MPRKYLMNWDGPPNNRWRKLYKGVMYSVKCSDLGMKAMVWTKEGTYRLANAWWEKKQREIDGAEPIASVAEPIRRTVEALGGTPVRTEEEASRAMARAVAGLAGLTNEEVEAVADATDGNSAPSVVYHAGKSADGPATIGRMVEKLVALERQKQRVGKVSGGRADMNRVCLYHFRDWIGAQNLVTVITGAKWTDFYAYLCKQLEEGVWGEAHCDRIFMVAKRFVRTLWEWDMIGLPKSLDNKAYSFTVSPKKIEVFTDQELQSLFAAVKGQSRLHVLLMLNCGMLAKDVNDLRHDEVDWSNGIVERKRSKTKDHEDVPVVRYKLWDQTFSLLKEYRSKDPDIVLLTERGKRWILPKQGEDSWHRSDSIRSCLRNYMAKAKVNRPVKCLRATASSKLADHKDFKFYAQYFLGQSPRSVADKHYVTPSDKEFFLALEWLEQALLLSEM